MSFEVPSKSEKGEYHTVHCLKGGRWECDCIAFQMKGDCSHIKKAKEGQWEDPML